MMAPIVFTPAGPASVPAANYPRPDQGMAPPPCGCNGSNGSNAFNNGPPKPPAEDNLSASLNQISLRLDGMEKALRGLDQDTGKAIEVTNQTLLKTHKALEALEGRIKALGG
jgi:hypothetical protein